MQSLCRDQRQSVGATVITKNIEGPQGEYRYAYSSILSLTSVLDGVGG
jgi:hypothetical protein